MLVKQGCDEYSFTWGISEEVHETTVGKREGLGRSDFSLKQLGKESCTFNRSMVTFKGSIRYWNYLETCTDAVPADSRQLTLSVRKIA